MHTAAASNLGQMLNRICLADGVPLVNIVRSPEQAAILRGEGAAHVCDSSAAGFADDLVAALKATGATLAFDAIGGGRLASDILSAMETVASTGAAYSRYGSSSRKQVYIYGSLDLGPTTLTRSFGLSWNVGGWLLTYFLQRAGRDTRARLQARVTSELKTTFASRYNPHRLPGPGPGAGHLPRLPAPRHGREVPDRPQPGAMTPMADRLDRGAAAA